MASKFYKKGKMKYNSVIINAVPMDKNMPKRFRVIKTEGDGYCGYYALNIGLGMCGNNKGKNESATNIKKAFKNFVNKGGNKNILAFETRRSSSKNWELANNKISKFEMEGFANEGLSYFNKYRKGERNLNWVEPSFWIWACIEYNVEINILVITRDFKVWYSYKPFQGENLCKIYILGRDNIHYSALEPVDEKKPNNNESLRRAIEQSKITVEENNEIRRAIEQSKITVEENKAKRKAKNLEKRKAEAKKREKKITSPIKRENNQLRRAVEQSIITAIENEAKRREAEVKKREKKITSPIKREKQAERRGVTLNMVTNSSINSLKENIKRRIEKRKNAIKTLLINYKSGKINSSTILKKRLQELRDEKNKNRQLINNLKKNISERNYRELIRILEN